MNNPDGIRILCGLADPALAADTPALQPFAQPALDFLSDLSASLLKNEAARTYPEIAAFAFFCRNKNLQAMRAEYDDLALRLGRGLVFHIAPGNVPMNFAYSLAAALLAGNASIVKAPSRAFEQVAITCDVMRSLLDGNYSAMKSYINVIEYPRERQDLTETFSELCNARVIWGGDETIRRVRQAPLAPRAFDITFADRWSLAVMDAGVIIQMKDAEITALAKGFYNDTYLYDQNACTAPRLCVWMGDEAAMKAAKQRFWNAVLHEADTRYPLDPVTAVDKRTELLRAAVLMDGIRLEETADNRLTRMHLDTLSQDVQDIRCTGGCFLEYDAIAYDELLPVLNEKTQTVACAGIDPAEFRAFVRTSGVKGVDRAVSIGHTLDFALIWDGVDLIRCLSRRIGC